jgi:hypothetical protein
MSLGVVVCLGYRCSVCRLRVPILRSTDPCSEDFLPASIHSLCSCGSGRVIQRFEINLLEIWREIPEPRKSGRRSARVQFQH